MAWASCRLVAAHVHEAPPSTDSPKKPTSRHSGKASGNSQMQGVHAGSKKPASQPLPRSTRSATKVPEEPYTTSVISCHKSCPILQTRSELPITFGSNGILLSLKAWIQLTITRTPTRQRPTCVKASHEFRAARRRGDLHHHDCLAVKTPRNVRNAFEDTL